MQRLSGGRRYREIQAIEGAGCDGDDIGSSAGIVRRRGQSAMAEQNLDDADIGAGFEQVRGEAVAQRVNGDWLAQIRLARRHPAGRLQRRSADRAIPLTAGEQPGTRLGQSPVGAKDAYELRREHDVAVLAAPRLPGSSLLPCSTRMTMRL